MSQPLTCPAELREILSWMGAELDMTELRVELVPAPDPHHCGHQVRAVMERNPDWYRDLLAMFPRNRRDRDPKYTDSHYTRRDVRNVIQRLLGNGTRSVLGPHLIDMARQEFDKFQEEVAA